MGTYGDKQSVESRFKHPIAQIDIRQHMSMCVIHQL